MRTSKIQVLILVVLEDAHKEFVLGRTLQQWRVLILVVLEDAHKAQRT